MILHFNNFVLDNKGNVWVAENRFNGLFCKKSNEEIQFIGYFDGEESFGRNLFRDVIVSGDYMIFAPWGARYIHVVNTNNNNMHTIVIGNDNMKKYDMSCFYGLFVHNNTFYCLQACSTTIFCIDIETDRTFTLDIVPVKESQDYVRFWNFRVYQNGENVYLCNGIDGYIIRYNLNTNKAKTIHFPDYIGKIYDYLVTERGLYISNENGTIVLYKNESLINVRELGVNNVSFVRYKSDIYLYSEAMHQVISGLDDCASEAVNDRNKHLTDILSSNIVGDELFIQKKDGSFGFDFMFLSPLCIDNYACGLDKEHIIINETKTQDLAFFVDCLVNDK